MEDENGAYSSIFLLTCMENLYALSILAMA
jgi:hypothetical protein